MDRHRARMTYLLDLGDGSPMIPCRDQHQALALARLYVAARTGKPAVIARDGPDTEHSGFT